MTYEWLTNYEYKQRVSVIYPTLPIQIQNTNAYSSYVFSREKEKN